LEKYNSSGEKLWSQKVADIVDSVEFWSRWFNLDDNGNSYIVFYKGTSKYIAKYNSDGEQLWVEEASFENGYVGLSQLLTNPNGNLFVYTSKVISSEVIDTGGPRARDTDLILYKFDSEGNLGGTKVFGEGVREVILPYALVSNQNNIALLFESSFNLSNSGFGLYDFDGNEIWLKHTSDISNTYTVSTVALSCDNNLFTLSLPPQSRGETEFGALLIHSFDEKGNQQ
jgi:hypothetical protein